MCQQFDKDFTSSSRHLDLPARSYRRQMKPILPRKVTAPARINLNKFWNDLEEFYNRYDERKISNNNNPLIDLKSVYNSLPAYTTDTYDHGRESAENDLNEQMESQKFDTSSYKSYSSSTSGVESYDEDSGSEDWDCFSPSYVSYGSNAKMFCWDNIQRPPRNLTELISRIATKN